MYCKKLGDTLLLRFYKCMSSDIIFTKRYKMQMTGIIEKKVSVNNIEINCLQTGKGDHSVFCLPGSLGTIWTDFSPQIIGFDLNKFSIIVWDPPGYGKSIPPKRDFCIDYLERDADLAAQLLQKLEIPKCSLLGWSDGGITALFLAAKYPEHVNKLVVWGANAFLTNEDLNAYEKIKNVKNWSVGMRNSMMNIYGEQLLQQLINEWFDIMKKIQNTREGDICKQLVSNIVIPTLILHGAKDPLVPKIHCEFLHKYIQNSKLHIFQDGKHNIHLKFSEFFNKTVQEFLLEK